MADTTPLPSNPRTFRRFKELPLEIRLCVWQFALPDPRIVCIKQEPLEPLEGPQLYAIRSFSPPPSILFVNRESFALASKFYERAFACDDATYPQPGFSQTWIDFRRDIVYIEKGSFMYRHHWNAEAGINNIPRSDLDRVQNLALYTGFDGMKAGEVGRILGTLGGVKNLYLVTDHGVYDTYEHDYTMDELYDLRFWDVEGEEQISIEDAFKIFERIKRNQKAPLIEKEWMPTNEFEIYDISEEDLEKERLKWPQTQGRCLWEMPHIEYRVILSAVLKKKLEEARAYYYAIIEENALEHKSHMSGECKCGWMYNFHANALRPGGGVEWMTDEERTEKYSYSHCPVYIRDLRVKEMEDQVKERMSSADPAEREWYRLHQSYLGKFFSDWLESLPTPKQETSN